MIILGVPIFRIFTVGIFFAGVSCNINFCLVFGFSSVLYQCTVGETSHFSGILV